MQPKTTLILLTTLLLATPGHTKSTPKPTPEAELQQTEKAIQQAKNDQQRIEAQTAAIEAELANLQSQLVKLAAIAQKSEAELSTAEDKLTILTNQLMGKEQEFKTRQAHLSTLVSAAISLSHTPPEAMIMMPGDVTQTMKAARALKMSSAAVKAETQSLGLQLIELQKLKDKVSQEHDELQKRQELFTTSKKA